MYTKNYKFIKEHCRVDIKELLYYTEVIILY